MLYNLLIFMQLNYLKEYKAIYTWSKMFFLQRGFSPNREDNEYEDNWVLWRMSRVKSKIDTRHTFLHSIQFLMLLSTYWKCLGRHHVYVLNINSKLLPLFSTLLIFFVLPLLFIFLFHLLFLFFQYTIYII